MKYKIIAGSAKIVEENLNKLASEQGKSHEVKFISRTPSGYFALVCSENPFELINYREVKATKEKEEASKREVLLVKKQEQAQKDKEKAGKSGI